VAIAMFLYTISGFMVSSLDSMTLASIERSGRFHAQIASWDDTLYHKLSDDKRVETTALNVGIGLLPTSGATSIHFEEWDATMFGMMGLELISGRLPGAQNEIVLDEEAAAFYDNPSIGATIRVSVPCMSATGEIIGEISDTFIVSGIAEKNALMGEVSHQVLAVIGSGYVEATFDNYAEFTRFISLRVFDVNSLGELYFDYGIENDIVYENQSLIDASSGAYSDSNPLSPLTIPLTIIVAIASILILSNIFSISHLSRIKELGLLRVIGMTNGQAYKLNMAEALLLSCIGIPIGLFLAHAVSGALLPSILIALDPEGSLVETEFYHLTSLVTISFAQVIQAIGIACSTVVLSSVWSTFRSRKLDPVKLFVNVPSDKQRRRITRSKRDGSFLSLIFMEISRDRKRTALGISSIVLSVTLFLVFLNVLSTASVDGRIKEQMIGDFAVYSVPQNGERIESWSKIEPQAVSALVDEYGLSAYTLRIIYDGDGPRAFVIDDVRFAELLQDANAGSDAQGVIAYIGCEEESVSIDGKEYPVIGHLDKTFPGVDSIYYYYLSEAMLATDTVPMRRVDFKVDDDNYDAVHVALNSVFGDSSSYSIGTYTETKAQLERELATLRTVIYSFLAIIMIIALINIMNTLYSSALLNISEYAIERTIGATMSQIAAIQLLQSVFLAGAALLVSIPLSAILIITLSNGSGLSVALYAAASAGTILACVAASLPAIVSLRRRPLIDTILRG
jgi:ABC-type antimicrobial peptide transport system permease subunit